jgi:hypothetical protein
MRKLSSALLIIGVLVVVAAIVQAQWIEDPVENGYFHDGLEGWTPGGYGNHLVSCVQENGNHMAKLEVGPTGQTSNFAFLDQVFTLPRNRCVQLDFDVPLPGIPDPTENTPYESFDRVEIDFVIPTEDPKNSDLLGVVTIDYIASTGETIGWMQLNDNVLHKVSSVEFDPTSTALTTLGPLSIEGSRAFPGWLHFSMDVRWPFFSWLPENSTFRITARLEDNGRTGQDFSIVMDNVTAMTSYCATTVEIDIKPGAAPNRVKPGKKGSIPVAILTTDYFDVAMVDPVTVKFGPDGASPRSFGLLEDIDGDGDMDLLFHFKTFETGIQCGDTTAILDGETFEGRRIRGEDSIATAGCR